MAYTTNIYARRIRSGLGASDCGPGQTLRGDVTYAGAKGQCMTDAQYAECKSKGAIFGRPCTVDAGGGFWESFNSGLSTLFTGTAGPAPTPGMTPAQVQAMMAAQRGGGMSTNTMIAIGLGAVGLLALVMVTRK